MSEKKATQSPNTAVPPQGDELTLDVQDGNGLRTTSSMAVSGIALWKKGAGLNSFEQGGSGDTATGDYSLSEGNQNLSSGDSAHSEGKTTISSGLASHSEGNGTTASGDYAHTEGGGTLASNIAAHAEGSSTQATGTSSHAEGELTVASGDRAHAEGDHSIAHGLTSHAEGDYTLAMGNKSHAEGSLTIAVGTQGHVEGKSTNAYGSTSHAEGALTQANGSFSHAEGNRSIAGSPVRPFQINSVTVTIFGEDVTAEFDNGNPVTIFINSDLPLAQREVNSVPVFANGNTTFNISSGIDPSATDAFIVNTHVGENAHAQGSLTRATGTSAHSEGTSTLASGISSHAGGSFTRATGNNSFTGGQGVNGFVVSASGKASFNHSECTVNNASDAQAANSVVLGGVNNKVTSTGLRSVLLGGTLRSEAEPDYVNVPRLRVSTVGEYDDNAAALTAGLTIGAIYRTGDLLKIVH